MTTIQRLISERNAMNQEPLEVMGAPSDDVNKYLPLATGALAEVVSSQLKNKEDAAKQAAFDKSDAGVAQKAAKDLTVKAQLAAADASAEADPNGPKHKAALDLALQAQAATAKAAVYAAQGQGGGGAALSALPGGKGGHGGESFFEKYKWPLVIGGGVTFLGLIVLIARRK